MAVVIHKRENELEKQIKQKNKKIMQTWIISLPILIVVTFLLEEAAFLVFLLALIITLRLLKGRHIIKVGIEGENKALKLMEKLDGDYHVFNNLYFEHEGKISETDLVLVGNKGIFVIEVKNHNGLIVGNEEDKQWEQHKTGRKGGEYSKQFYNPTKQVGTHVYRFSQYLKGNGFNFWIQGMVLFLNPEANIHVKTKKIPVLQTSTDIISYIDQLQVKRELTKNEINDVVNLLKNHSLKNAS